MYSYFSVLQPLPRRCVLKRDNVADPVKIPYKHYSPPIRSIYDTVCRSCYRRNLSDRCPYLYSQANQYTSVVCGRDYCDVGSYCNGNHSVCLSKGPGAHSWREQCWFEGRGEIGQFQCKWHVQWEDQRERVYSHTNMQYNNIMLQSYLCTVYACCLCICTYFN